MLNRFIILFICLWTSLCLCPNQCNCSPYTFNCSLCLNGFYRIYDSTSQDCVCMAGFIEMRPLSYSCRPTNCTTYNDQGCVGCLNNWELSYNDIFQVYVCVCQTNYFFINESCVCNSILLPTQYYQSLINDYCKSCPTGCTCDQTGCYTCSSQTYRNTTVQFNITVCNCASPYVEINGTCRAYDGCQITTNSTSAVMICNDSSNRQLLGNGSWVCILPYADINGSCTCVQPMAFDYYIIKSNTRLCACKSKLYPTIYYQNNGICSYCPDGCRCSQYGCVECNQASNRVIIGTSCPCATSYIESQQKCVCVEPYYLYTSLGTSTCMCLSSAYSEEFFYDYNLGICYRCPNGCTCTTFGCVSCTSSLRVIESFIINNTPTNISTTFMSCRKCIDSAIQVNGVCTCSDYSTYNQQLNTCLCNNSTQIFTNITNISQCLICPMGCNCTEFQGCKQCSSELNRQIIGLGYLSCPCQLGYALNSLGVCECALPYMYFNNSCVCTDPYELTEQGCQCKSLSQPSAYYYDNMNSICASCPVKCDCNSSGCFNCDPNTLRVNIIYYGSSICPCLQTAFEANNTCSFCAAGYTVVNDQCVACPNCATCDVAGCTTCSNNTFLDDHECVCSNSSTPELTNINGICVCGFGLYFNNTSNTCIQCPKQCHTCIDNKCTACRSDVYRRNAIDNNCPCQDGYKQLAIIDIFCCPQKCQTCNLTNCITCNTYSNREYVNDTGDCVCIDTYIDIGEGLCGCASNTTQYGGACLNCPANCNTCLYNTTSNSMYCTSCRNNMNRNTSDLTSCECQIDFMEAPIKQIFCIPIHCLYYNNDGSCNTCDGVRQFVSNNFACVCPLHFYDTGDHGSCSICSGAIVGCIDCKTQNLCTECNEAQGYLLISTTNSTTCELRFSTDLYLLSQTHAGILIQLKMTDAATKYEITKSVIAVLYTIYSNVSDLPPDNSVELNVTNYRIINNNILEVRIQNPNSAYSNKLLKITYMKINYTIRNLREISVIDTGGEYIGVQQSSPIQQKLLYGSADLALDLSWKYTAQIAAVANFMAIALVLYVRGYKHNQISFFLQTLGFLAFTIDDPEYSIATFLYPMKMAYYQFGERTSIIPMPDGYFQSSLGNFSFFTSDSNIFRVADSTFLTALGTCFLIGILRVIYYTKQNSSYLSQVSCINNLSNRTKKTIYRFLQFFYKTCMYPLIFFSIMTMRNWNALLITNYTIFRGMSCALCVLLLAAYTIVTLWQWFKEITAKVNRIENLCQFVTTVASSLIITFTIGSNLFLMLMLVFCLRAFVYMKGRKILRDFLKIEYMKIGTTIQQCITLYMIVTKSIPGAAFSAFGTVILQTIHEILILFYTSSIAKIDKIMKDPITDGDDFSDAIIKDNHTEVMNEQQE